MASGGTSLRFSVVVAADQAEQALKAMTLAFNQAGVSAKTAMAGIAPAAKSAGAEIVSLGDKMKAFAREQRSESRAASFFVNEIAQIVPVSGEAKIALSGLGAALIGGAGIFSALQLVTTAISLFVAESQKEAEASKKAAEAAKERADAYTKNRVALERLRYTQGGGVGDVFDAYQANRAAEAQFAAAKKAHDEARRIFEQAKASIPAARALSDEEAAKYYANLRGLLAKVKLAADDLAVAEKNRATVSEIGSRESAAAIDKETEALARRNKEAEVRIDSATASPGGYYNLPSQGASKLNFMPLNDGLQRNPVADAKRAQDAYNQSVQRSIELGKQWGDAIGNVVAGLMTGQMNARQAVASILQMMIKEATAYAIAASIAGAKSQAVIPGIGPILAISTAGSLLASLMGMIGSMPSARGGWDVPAGWNGLAMIHEREMVLPAREADAIRSGGMGGGITVNVGGVIDGRNLEQALTARDGAVARAERKRERRRRR